MFDNFNEHEKSSASTQVEEIQAILGAEYPIVIKSMIHSNVSSWNCLVSLNLCAKFRRTGLGAMDKYITNYALNFSI